MRRIKEYPIIIDMHTKNDCYKAARVRQKTHVIVHSTAAKGPAYVPRWQTWNTPDFKKCAHGFIDWNGIYQCLPWNYQGWLVANSKGNDCSIGFEICEPLEKNDTPEMAADLYAKTLFLCVHLCREFEIAPENVICHAEAHKLGLANNHADVTHWWGKKGTSWEPYTMARLRAEVKEALGIIEPVEDYPYDALVATKTSPLNIWDSPSKGRSLGQIKKGDTVRVIGSGGLTGWYQVEKDVVKGFADGQYLEKMDAQTVPEMPEIPSEMIPPYQARVVNVKTGLNLRSAPSKAADNTFLFIPPDGMVTVLLDNCGDGFAYVQFGLVLGYCTRSYLMAVDEELDE